MTRINEYFLVFNDKDFNGSHINVVGSNHVVDEQLTQFEKVQENIQQRNSGVEGLVATMTPKEMDDLFSGCYQEEASLPNAPKVSSDESKTESAPKFTFGIPSSEAKTTSATPAFTGFGVKPVEKKETAPPAVTAPAASAPVAPVSGGFGDLLAKQKAAAASKWTCDICMVSNDASALKCLACEAPNPKAPAQSAAAAETASAAPKFVFGVQPSTSTETKKDAPSFSFGAPAAQPTATDAPKPSFSFGTSAPAKETSPAPIPTLKRGRDTSSTPSSSATSSGFSFGSSAAAPAKKEAPSFSFGASSGAPTTTTAAEPPKPAFSFGAPASTPAATPAPTSGFSFGAKQEENKAAAPSFSFGAPKETPAQPATTGGSLFGASEPKATPSFSFGGAPKQEEKPAAAPSFSFGAGGASKPAGGFGNQSSGSLFAPKVEEKQPSFNFGASKPAEQSSFSFGATQNASPSGGSLFGAAPQQNQAAAPSFNFGGSNKHFV